MARPEDAKTRSHAWSGAAPGDTHVILVWDGGTITKALAPGTTLVIGRADDCDLQILHPAVSRRHARVTAGPPVRIEDLGGTNGVRVDGERVTKEPRVVLPGQVVEVGAAMLFLREPARPDQATAPGPKTRTPRVDQDRFVSLIARSHLPVLILGETGAGKEVMATRIHEGSPRRDGPFVRLNCAAFPESLLESELFGHERGAFTGAAQAKRGLIEAAHRGTLLLDEVGDMPLAAQAALLRVLETQEVRRVGAVETVSVDVRVLSATNANLEARVATGQFRHDLLFRLNGVTIEVPALRERRSEIVTIAKELLSRAAARAHLATPKLTPGAESALLAHAWPGNVRELKNVVERALVLAEGGPIETSHLLLGGSPHGDAAPTLRESLGSLERAQIERALVASRGNQTKAAELLGMSRRALINRLDEYGMPRPRKPG